MIINYKKIFWGDSKLEKIEIAGDTIVITVFNDVLEKIFSLHVRNVQE